MIAGTGVGIGASALAERYLPELQRFPGAGFLGVGEEKPKRRRRRRALTASDRADIAFIAGMLGQPAGRQFAMLIGSRTAS